MPMIDVTAVAGTFGNKRDLIKSLTHAMMKWEKVPPISLFLDNTAAFIHELPADAMGNAAGANNYIKINILTPVGILDREKKLGVVKELTEIVVAASGDRSYAERTWCLIAETPDGGWGLDGHAHTNEEIAAAARRELSKK